jgi:short-subunit dehydrogenase
MSQGAAALITGASSGIGAELAKRCASAGYRVILCGRNAEALQDMARDLPAPSSRVLIADLSDPAAVRSIYEQTRDEPIEILVNNAGFGLRGPFADNDWDTESRMIQVNAIALAQLTKLFVRRMRQSGGGRILNVASTAAFAPGPFMAVYYATKAFVVSFSHAIANELYGSGITVTVLCPGPTLTGFQKVAGIERSSLFQGPTMSAKEVAREGFDAMMAGRVEVIAGSRNRWMILGTRLAPRTMLAKLTRRLNVDRAQS